MATKTPNALADEEIESQRRFKVLVSASGILGCLTLIIYFAAPFTLFPFPASNATADQIIANATQYKTYYLLAAWLQGTGTLLIVIFVLGLVYIAKAWTRFAGWITMLASGAVLMLSLTEATFFLDTALAVGNGHPEAAVTSFDLTFVFLHSFFIAPPLLLPLAFIVRKSNVLPRVFWPWALATGLGFVALGFLGLFVTASIPEIIALIVMVIWMISAATALAFRKEQSKVKAG